MSELDLLLASIAICALGAVAVGYFIYMFINEIKFMKENKYPLKALIYPVAILIAIYCIWILAYCLCSMAGWKVVTVILRVLLIMSAFLLWRFLVRPCRLHIWIVEKTIGSEAEYVKLLKKAREIYKLRRDVENG